MNKERNLNTQNENHKKEKKQKAKRPWWVILLLLLGLGGLVGGGFGIGFAVAHFSNSKNPDNPVNPGNTIYQLNPSSPALALDINNATNANVTFAPTHNGEPTSDLSIQLAEHQESEHVFDYVELRNGALVWKTEARPYNTDDCYATIVGTINGQVKCSAHISLAHSLAPVYSVTLSSAILDTTPISLIETKNGSYVHSGDINYTFSDDTYVEIVNHQIVWKDPSVRPHESLNCSVSANASGIDIMTQPFVLMPDTSSNYEIEVSTHSIQYGHTIDNEVELDLLLNDAEVLSSDYTLDFQVSGGYDNISLFLDGDQWKLKLTANPDANVPNMVIEAMIGTDVVASVSIGVYKADAQVCVIETNTSSINIGGSTTITGKLSATNFTPTVLNTAIPESVQPNFGSFNFNPVDGTFSVNLLTVVEGAYNLSLISGGIASNNILIHVQSSTTTVVQLSLDNNHLDLFHNETITATVTTTNLSPTGDPTWSPSGHGLTITALDNWTAGVRHYAITESSSTSIGVINLYGTIGGKDSNKQFISVVDTSTSVKVYRSSGQSVLWKVGDTATYTAIVIDGVTADNVWTYPANTNLSFVQTDTTLTITVVTELTTKEKLPIKVTNNNAVDNVNVALYDVDYTPIPINSTYYKLYNGNRYVGGFSNAVNSGLISLAGFNAIDFTGTSTDHIYGRESDTFSSYAFEHSNIQKIDLSGFVFAAGRYPTARENGYKIFYHNDLHTVTKINLSDADFLDTEGSSTGGDDLYTASHTFDGCNLSSLNELQLNMTHFSSPGLLWGSQYWFSANCTFMNTNMSNLTKLDLYNTAICNITDGSLFTQSSIAAGSEMFAGANLSRLEKIYFPTVGGTYNYQDGSSGYFWDRTFFNNTWGATNRTCYIANSQPNWLSLCSFTGWSWASY